MGKTVVLSSHILSELAELCDSIGISSAGAGYLRKAGYLHPRPGAGRPKAEPSCVLSSKEQAETILRSQPGVGEIIIPQNGNGGASSSVGTNWKWISSG